MSFATVGIFGWWGRCRFLYEILSYIVNRNEIAMIKNPYNLAAMILLDTNVEKKLRTAHTIASSISVDSRSRCWLNSDLGRRKIMTQRGLRILVLQSAEDRSNREMKRFLKELMEWLLPTLPGRSRKSGLVSGGS